MSTEEKSYGVLGAEWMMERLEAMLSLDVEKFKAYLAKYEIPMPAVSDETLLAGMHYARLNANFISDADKEVSAKWLVDSGYNPYPRYG